MIVLRWLIAIFMGLAATGGGVVYWLSLPLPSITVVSWGDAYQRAQMVTMFHPYTDETGVGVTAIAYGGGLREVRQQVESGEVTWDVVDFEYNDAITACREGLLEEIDAGALPPGADGTPASEDFIPGAIGPCWVGSIVYSHMIAADPARFDTAPTVVSDFFDLERFPGARGLRDSGPQYNLELALLADGVAPEMVYPTLESEEGVMRAFAKLDTIKPSIRWWQRLDDSLGALEAGDVAMTTTLNGRMFDAAMEGKDILPLWHGQLYEFDVFAIPKGSANRELAEEFIRFATASAPLAGQAGRLPFGPARRSALALIRPHPQTGVETRPFLPTAPENFRNALALDWDWWAAHGEELDARWTAWRAQ